jgi:hypothetical protein
MMFSFGSKLLINLKGIGIASMHARFLPGAIAIARSL